MYNQYKLECKDKELLKEKEATMSFNKLIELQIHPLNMGFDKEHLMEIHKYIFCDIYPGATTALFNAALIKQNKSK